MIKPKIGMYLVDKEYKNTIYRIEATEDNDSWDYFDPRYKIEIVEGKNDAGSGTWFDETEINKFFFEIEYNDTTRTLYGVKR